jgi:hypothetical protein
MKFAARFVVLGCLVLLVSCGSGPKEDRESRTIDPALLAKIEPIVDFAPRTYVCFRTDGPIAVDGVMDEGIWEKAPWSEDFTDIEGDSRPKPMYRTRVKMLWDDDYFYIGADLEEPHIWATLTEHDAVIFRDNDFEVFMDPDGDTQAYYEFEMNAFNTGWDLLLVKPYRDPGVHAVNGWHLYGMKSAVKIHGTINRPSDKDRGWTVELAFPWNTLKECAPLGVPKDGVVWRVNFSRVEYDVSVVKGLYEKIKDPATGKPLPEHNWVWSPQGVINIHYPEMWGFVQFSDRIAASDSAEYQIPASEKTAWYLRKLYYRQRAYLEQHGRYAKDLKDLHPQAIGADARLFRPVLQTTQSFYEITAPDLEGKGRWHIMHDGRVWKTEP